MAVPTARIIEAAPTTEPIDKSNSPADHQERDRYRHDIQFRGRIQRPGRGVERHEAAKKAYTTMAATNAPNSGLLSDARGLLPSKNRGLPMGSSPLTMRKVDGWQTLAERPANQNIDLAA
jgi:hypothetical protein